MLHLPKIVDLLAELQKQEKEIQEMILEESFASLEQRLVQLESVTSRMHQYHSRREDIILSLEEEVGKYEYSTRVGSALPRCTSSRNRPTRHWTSCTKSTWCSICDLKCESHGRHSMVSLRCGHLFGRHCINNVLRESSRCPTCSRAARQHEVRRIYGLHFYPI
ncbi:GD13307 [Drosophila simulans]|uniref:GD13307 n=1 Tax=Drosophila simulans TaxID=7240 RepID=B4QQ10_DROSI|nr:GD13307 [Drosophila simulans]